MKRLLLVVIALFLIAFPVGASGTLPLTCADYPTASCTYIASAPYIHPGPVSVADMDAFCAANGHTAAFTNYGAGYAAPGNVLGTNWSGNISTPGLGWETIESWNSGASWPPENSWTNHTIPYDKYITSSPVHNSWSVGSLIWVKCQGGGTWGTDIPYSLIIANVSPFNVSANFTATPLSGTGPFNVSFVDTSLNVTGSVTYTWSISPATGWFVSAGTINSKDVGILFSTNGNYTITHGVSTAFGSDTETKTDYIQVYNSTATTTTGFRAKDTYTGGIVTTAEIHLKDVENNSWVNGSTNHGVASITVLSGHHIDAYASAMGYGDADYLNQPATLWTYDIMMLPIGFANVSSGNVTAYITVKDYDTLQVVVNALVTAQYSGGTGVTGNTQTTTGAGVASFVLPNNTVVHFSASKSGYITGVTVLNTGTGSGGDAHVTGNISISKNIITGTPTITTLPGGGTPVPTVTYLPGCDPSASDYNAAKCRSEHSNSALNLLAGNMDNLVMLCLFVTVMYLLGIRLGR
jgi:PKD repeat protein